MTRETAPRYTFRPLTGRDRALLARWFRQPHVREWWDDSDAGADEILALLDDISVEPLIVEIDGKAVGYIQSYDPHLEDDHPYADQPFGTLGIDQFIGEPGLVGKGHGPAFIRQFCDLLFEEGAPRIVTDPDWRNARAIRAYAKAGFSPVGERRSQYGHVLLMARDAPEGVEGENDI